MKKTRILVDADACPVVDIVENVARKYRLEVILFCDTNHILTSSYSQVRTISAGADAVDIAVANECVKNDIVVTQDYGVAVMTLAKKAFAIHQSGKRYTDDNIELMLTQRYIAKKARRASGKSHLKGPKKRTSDDDKRFEHEFEILVREVTEMNRI